MCTYIQTMGQANSQYQDKHTVKPSKMLLVKFKEIRFINPLTGSFLGCWCHLPWVFKCLLFLVVSKQEKRCKHNGGYFQYEMKT